MCSVQLLEQHTRESGSICTYVHMLPLSTYVYMYICTEFDIFSSDMVSENPENKDITFKLHDKVKLLSFI